MRAVERGRGVGPERHRQLERLSRVAQVGLALGRQLARLLKRTDERLDPVAPLVADREPQRRQDARLGRHQDRLDPELTRELAGV